MQSETIVSRNVGFLISRETAESIDSTTGRMLFIATTADHLSTLLICGISSARDCGSGSHGSFYRSSLAQEKQR
jgi:hypothetical protein